jgi:uncharacterized damage-inducible protein DinB
MNVTEFLLSEMNREVERSRRALQEVPTGKYDWKPHDKNDELDVAPEAGSRMKREPIETNEALVKALDEAAADARSAFAATTDDHLQTTWKLLAHGKVVMQAPRYQMIQDTINHWSHHRGQMTVYLRLMGAKVPALYGPSADDQRFL